MFPVLVLLAAPAGIAGGLAIAPIAAIGGAWVLWRGRGKAEASRILALLGPRPWWLFLALSTFFVIGTAAAWVGAGSGLTLVSVFREANIFWNFVLWTPLFAIAAIGIAALEGEARETTSRALVACVTLLTFLLLFQYVSDFALTAPLREVGEDPARHVISTGKGAPILACWLWPALVILGRSDPRAAFALYVAAGFAIWAYDIDANRVAFVAGSLAFLACRIAPRTALAAGFSLVCAGLLFAPLIVSGAAPVIGERWAALPESWKQRFETWEVLAASIRAHPFGGGIGAGRRIDHAFAAAHPGHLALHHPHNAALELWTDVGVFGVAALIAILALLGWRAMRAPAACASPVAGVLAASVAVACVGYSIWNPWWLATLVLGAGLCTLAFDRENSGPVGKSLS